MQSRSHKDIWFPLNGNETYKPKLIQIQKHTVESVSSTFFKKYANITSTLYSQICKAFQGTKPYSKGLSLDLVEVLSKILPPLPASVI